MPSWQFAAYQVSSRLRELDMSPPMFIAALVFAIGISLATWKAPRLTSVIFWALIAAIFLTSFLLMHLPGPFSEKALWLTLGVPIIWVGLQFWTYWDGKPWRVTGGLIAISIICAVIVFTTVPSGLSTASAL